MASIAVSLSGGRRTSGSLPHHASLRTCASTDAIKTAKGSNTTDSQRRSASKQLRNELELLRKMIQEKDVLIQRYIRPTLVIIVLCAVCVCVCQIHRVIIPGYV